MLDYIDWRGDLTFETDAFNEVDNFIFCMLSYVDFNRIYDSYNPDVKISIKDAAEVFVKTHDQKSLKALGVIIPWENIRKMLYKMGKSQRFSPVQVSDFTNEIDYEREMQFCAMTFHLNADEMLVCFRGTDETLIAWKEDFRLSYLSEIPAQKRASEYLLQIAEKYPDKKIYVGGHSKGGNLAKYSSVYATDEVLERIDAIYNNDGPGFLPDIVSSERFARIERKVKNFVPQSSLVGQMFLHRGQRIIVRSNYRGVYQHDIFGWEIKGTHAVTVKSFTSSGEINHEIFNTRINGMTLDERREFVDVFCHIIDSTGAKNLLDLSEARAKSAALVLKSYGELEKEKKQLMQSCLTRLFDLRNLKK